MSSGGLLSDVVSLYRSVNGLVYWIALSSVVVLPLSANTRLLR